MSNDKTFQIFIEKHLVKFKSNRQYMPPTNKKKWLYHDMSDNLFPPIKHGFLQYAYDSGIPLHDFANHVRSSQIFCINVFFHLIKNETDVLLDVLSYYSKIKLINLESYEFEYSAEKNILGEWKSDENRPEEYVTATDLFIIATDELGNSIGFLIEVKFSENDFTSCGGFNSKANLIDSKTICNNGIRLFDDFDACYLHGAHGKSKLKRKYLDYFSKEDFNSKLFNDKCPFINNHQCIRNQSLLRALIKERKIKRGFFVLVHHDMNESIIDEWRYFEKVLSNDARNEILNIKTSEFIKKSGDANFKKYFKDRYLI